MSHGGRVPQRARPLRPGDPQGVGVYEVIGFLGEGGMGVVYVGRARDGSLVAIKVVREELARNHEFRQRFRREADSAMRVPRFCTAEVLAADPDARSPYLVTEYIDGPTLEEVVTTEGPLRGAELDQLGVSMAAALTGIHSVGVIHRDLKPANVLLSRLGPRVIDFGIASAIDAIKLTADGQALGTPTYMAPEQLQGNPGQASDVFAWGGVMAFAATGRRPFGTGPLPEVAARIMYEQPDLTGVVGPLHTVITAAMTKNPVDRPNPSRLLELLGVSGTDPQLAVKTRLEGWGLSSPTAPPPDSTRLDIDTATLAAQTSAPPPYNPSTSPNATPHDPTVASTSATGQRPTTRFGPGVPANAGAEENPLSRTWRGGAPPPPPRRKRPWFRRVRSILSTLVSVAIIGGVIAWLLMQRQSTDLSVTGLTVAVDGSKHGCGDEVHLTGTVATNGSAGDLAYQWQRSDRPVPEPQQTQQVVSGQKTVPLEFLWNITGPGNHKSFTATLTILNGSTPLKQSASFTYNCKG